MSRTKPAKKAVAELKVDSATFARLSEIDVVEPAKLPAVAEEALDGELSTINVEEYVQGVYDGIQDALGPVDLHTAACALDMSIDTLLAVVSHAEGPELAKQFAMRYLQTALPYATPKLDTKPTYAQLRDLRKKV